VEAVAQSPEGLTGFVQGVRGAATSARHNPTLHCRLRGKAVVAADGLNSVALDKTQAFIGVWLALASEATQALNDWIGRSTHG